MDLSVMAEGGVEQRQSCRQDERPSGLAGPMAARSRATHFAQLADAPHGPSSQKLPGHGCVTFRRLHEPALRPPTGCDPPVCPLPALRASTRSFSPIDFLCSPSALPSCPAAGYVLHRLCRRPPLTPPSGERGRLRHTSIAGVDEEQAQGRPDRP